MVREMSKNWIIRLRQSKSNLEASNPSNESVNADWFQTLNQFYSLVVLGKPTKSDACKRHPCVTQHLYGNRDMVTTLQHHLSRCYSRVQYFLEESPHIKETDFWTAFRFDIVTTGEFQLFWVKLDMPVPVWLHHDANETTHFYKNLFLYKRPG